VPDYNWSRRGFWLPFWVLGYALYHAFKNTEQKVKPRATWQKVKTRIKNNE